MPKKVRAAAAENAAVAAQPEPEDEIPVEYRLAAIRAELSLGRLAPFPFGIVVRTVAYTAAVSWPFLALWTEYEDDIGAGGGSEFVSRALLWAVPASAASALAVGLVNKAVRNASGRARVREPEDAKPPVPRLVIAGMFVGVCALAFLVGVLRGVMINGLGY